ncbi:MAG: ABC transporter ATP-binding protein [Gemmataceae bacterium]
MLLHTEELTKEYGRFRALDRLGLEIAAGEVFGLLGPNGSGKSTALRLLLGFLKPSSGRATIAGHDCWRHSVQARKHLAYLPGELRLYENMTGRQLIAFLSRVRGQRQLPELAGLARRFDIDVDRPIADLSSGMKRKIALLQVMVTHAPLLIMDEPTNALDPTMRDELLAQIRAARALGQAVLFSSHVLHEVEQVCDRVGILKQGRLVHLQAISALREGRLVRARFEQEVAVPELPGLAVLRRQDLQLELEYTGSLPPLLDWLARQPVTSLSLEPLGLASIYQRIHGADA